MANKKNDGYIKMRVKSDSVKQRLSMSYILNDDVNDGAKQKKKKERIKNQFKKGTKKFHMYTELRKRGISKYVEDFHIIKMENFTIYDKDGLQIKQHNGKMKSKILKKIIEKHPEAFIMINLGANVFKKLKLESYLKLCRIQKIRVKSKWEVMDDGSDEYELLDEEDRYFDSINSFLRYVVFDSASISKLSQQQERLYCYACYKLEYRAMFMFDDGSATYYKCLDDMLVEYGIEDMFAIRMYR